MSVEAKLGVGVGVGVGVGAVVSVVGGGVSLALVANWRYGITLQGPNERKQVGEKEKRSRVGALRSSFESGLGSLGAWCWLRGQRCWQSPLVEGLATGSSSNQAVTFIGGRVLRRGYGVLVTRLLQSLLLQIGRAHV